MTATVHGLAIDHDDIECYFRAHYGRLVRALTLVSGSREAAADAVQEAFVQAHLRWRRIRGLDDPVGWIRRVAINKLRDEHRRSTRKQRAVTRLAADPATSAIEAAPEVGEFEPLAAAVAALPRQQRLAVALYYMEGLTVAETADTLEVSEGAVKYHLHQARERLRTALIEGEPT